MLPPTSNRIVDVAQGHDPIDTTSPGAAWLMATGARAPQVQQQLAEGGDRHELVALHAHYAIEDRHFDPCEVVADLDVPLCCHAHVSGERFAAEVALFRVARSLLDNLTAPEHVGA
jgi:hypothetical protein